MHLAVLGGRGVSRRVALRHRTTYRFARPVTIYPHTIRLRPAPHTPATISGYSLTVDPGEHHITWHQDPFGGWAARLFFPGPSDHLELTVDLVTDLTPVNPFDFVVEDWASTVPFTWPEPLRGDLGPYLTPVDDGPDADLVTDWLERRRPRPGTPIIDFLVELNRAVRADVDHRTRMEPGVQPPSQTLAEGIGSCRDSAWLLVSLLRRLGLAARFASGYLVQLAEEGREDVTDLHAWAETYLPGAGWVGLDATSGLLCGEGHIPLSCAPRPEAAAPVSGATDPVEVDFSFESTLTRVPEGTDA
ncbi:transglutaminase family protein [Janibacter corallicola]|uniref:transglutaminase family protein n=1 Tax=Janibacter corallicola TaxID=415212 RepID=UPI001C3F1D6C|nr:transglutaminase family protein [Janibacter corallicola]